VLDASGNQLWTRSNIFDALGRIAAGDKAAPGRQRLRLRRQWNNLTVTDPLGRLTGQAFDALNRLVRITDPAKGIATAIYDAHDRPTRVTDPNVARQATCLTALAA